MLRLQPGAHALDSPLSIFAPLLEVDAGPDGAPAAAAAQAPVLDVFGSMPSNMAAQLRSDIAQLVARYADLAHAARPFVPGESPVPVSGKVIGTRTTQSVPWNIARAATFVKKAVTAVDIPVHVNVGMGVGGVPMMEAPPIDSVTRASKSLVQIGKADGL